MLSGAGCLPTTSFFEPIFHFAARQAIIALFAQYLEGAQNFVNRHNSPLAFQLL
jgi:hypothetical protein